MIIKKLVVGIGQTILLTLIVFGFVLVIFTFGKKPEVKYDSSYQLEYNQELDRMEVPLAAVISVTSPNGTSIPREHWENILRFKGYNPAPVTVSEEER